MDSVGGVGAVSIGIDVRLLAVPVALFVVWGVWKVAKLVWAAFSD